MISVFGWIKKRKENRNLIKEVPEDILTLRERHEQIAEKLAKTEKKIRRSRYNGR